MSEDIKKLVAVGFTDDQANAILEVVLRWIEGHERDVHGEDY